MKQKKILFKIFLLFFFLLIVFLSCFKIVKGLFLPQVTLKNISFVIGDFIAPPIPILLDEEFFYVNQQSAKISWTQVSDYQETNQPVFYNLKFGEVVFENIVENSFDLSDQLFSEGEFLFSVQACDRIKNCSHWSNSKKIMIDNQPPTLKVFSDQFLVREAVTSNWQTAGQVILGEELIRVGSREGKNLWNQNFIKQELSNVPALKNIGFEYQVESEEELLGFDELAFGVMVNNELLFYARAQDKGSWSQAILDLSKFKTKVLEIKFLAGNSGDFLNPSWVNLKNISSNWIVNQSEAQLIFDVQDNSGQPITISQELSGSKNKIQIEDVAGNKFEQVFNYVLDNQAPVFVNDLQASREITGEIKLEFTAPLENQTLTRYHFYDSSGNLLVEKPKHLFSLILPPHNFNGLETIFLENVSQNISQIKVTAEDAAINRSDAVVDIFE